MPIKISGINVVEIRGNITRGVEGLSQPEIMNIMRIIVWLCQFRVGGRIEVRIEPNLLTRIGLEAIPICPQDITDLLHSHNRSIREWLEYFVINYHTTDFPWEAICITR